MKKLLVLLSLVFIGNLHAQEIVQPLAGNPSLYTSWNPSVTKNVVDTSLDSTFIYSASTLSITDVWDDFSEDKFVDYPPSFTAPNVTSQWYYHLMNQTNTVPEPTNVIYCDSAHARHDSIYVTGGLPTTFTSYFTPHTIWVNDLSTYPINGQTRTFFDECYILIDSMIEGVPDPTQDTIWYFDAAYHGIDTCQYPQDSIHLFFANLNDPSQLWMGRSACRNMTMAVDPWSLGVATFDGVDSTGLPYEFGSLSAYGQADVLTSKPINLQGTSDVFLDFIYQAEGHGNMPEDQDSLILDLYLVDSAKWYPWWYASTPYPQDTWAETHIAIPTNFLDNGFQFRFRNYASLSGALDHWHIDYVNLNENPLLTPQPLKDLAVAYPVNTLLEDYTSVPWDHYQNLADKNAVLLDTAWLQVYNSDDTPTNVGNDMFLNVELNGSNQLNYNLPNPAGPSPWTSNWELGTNFFPYFVQPNFATSYVDTPNDSMAIFDVKINANADVAGSNVYDVNDTTRFQQIFKNYYAYDDGSAEVAYGIQGANSRLAYKFDAYEADTITGVLFHFVPSVNDMSGHIMLLTVWDDNGGEPGDIIYQDDFFTPHYPEYGGSKNEFRYYEFVNPAYPSTIPVGTTFYVGWEQIDNESLNVGMDRNIVNNDKIFFNTGGAWIGSSQPGSLMIRPVFSTGINHTLGEEELETYSEVGMYPNPTTDRVTFTDLQGDFTIQLYDLSGRLVINTRNESVINVDFLEKGVYIVDIRDDSGVSLFSEKLIVK